MPTTAIQPNVVFTAANAIALSVGASEGFALPTKGNFLSAQLSFTVAPNPFNLTIEVSLDNINWFNILTFTQATTLLDEQLVAAKFVRYNLNSNTGGSGLTVLLLVKESQIQINQSSTVNNPAGVDGDVQVKNGSAFVGVTGDTQTAIQDIDSITTDRGVVTVVSGPASLSTTITTTGNIAQLATAGSRTILMNNATLATIQGILAPAINGQKLTIISIGAGQVDLANQNGSASAADRIINQVTGTISLAAGVGRVDLIYDGVNSRWRVINHEQGDWITPAFAAGDYTANGSMTWTVASGDVVTMKYYLRGRTLQVAYFINSTTVGGTLNTDLRRVIPGGFTGSGTVRNTNHTINNGTVIVGLASVVNDTIIAFQLNTVANWAASTDNTGIHGVSTFSVQ